MSILRAYTVSLFTAIVPQFLCGHTFFCASKEQLSWVMVVWLLTLQEHVALPASVSYRIVSALWARANCLYAHFYICNRINNTIRLSITFTSGSQEWYFCEVSSFHSFVPHCHMFQLDELHLTTLWSRSVETPHRPHRPPVHEAND